MHRSLTGKASVAYGTDTPLYGLRHRQDTTAHCTDAVHVSELHSLLHRQPVLLLKYAHHALGVHPLGISACTQTQPASVEPTSLTGGSHHVYVLLVVVV